MGMPVQSVVFDDTATLAMGAAFDLACVTLRGFARDNEVREAIAKRIVEVAANGERDPVRLLSKAFVVFASMTYPRRASSDEQPKVLGRFAPRG
jgi:hypothetical protein